MLKKDQPSESKDSGTSQPAKPVNERLELKKKAFPALCMPDTAPIPFADGDSSDVKVTDMLDQMLKEVKQQVIGTKQQQEEVDSFGRTRVRSRSPRRRSRSRTPPRRKYASSSSLH
jgi:hypothetical protein